MEDAGGLAEALLEQSPSCHWIVGAGGEFLRVFGDPSGVFGRSAADLAGRTAAEALGPELAAAWGERFARALAGESLTLRERRGEAVWLILLFPIRTESGAPLAGGSATEITRWGAAEQELRYTVLGALKSQEFERRMISQFLHDKVGQNLTALGLQLDLARMDLESAAPAASARIVEIQRVLETMMGEVRDYSYELNPAIVERAGLRSALDRLAARAGERFNGTVRVNADPSLKMNPKVAAAMYHIAQEAVDNAVQHASCSAIEIAVKSTKTGCSIQVGDNGKGFDPADALSGRRGLGLLSMEHYAAEAGLSLSVKSSGETGTFVRAAEPGA
ncbi:MAG: histidine kinase [Bryobacteraceae bacterium]|jgi:two-component system NarL family sensor kinase